TRLVPTEETSPKKIKFTSLVITRDRPRAVVLMPTCTFSWRGCIQDQIFSATMSHALAGSMSVDLKVTHTDNR
ncbi:unnamed protein product, partial [Ectocarpus sp. 8 AP-2014]